jgi:ankyrin repeat protein
MPTVLQPTDEDTLFRVITCLANEGYNVNNVLQTNKAFWWDEQIWDAMKNKCGAQGMTPLMYNSMKGNTERLRWLLKRTPKLDVKMEGGSTALSLACYYKHCTIAKMLLDKGAKCMPTDDGSTCLITAVMQGNEAMVKMLLDHGADPTECNRVSSPLGRAAYSGSLNIVKMLCDAGAHLEVRDGINFTPLIDASRNGYLDVVTELIQRGADVNAVADWGYGRTPLFVAALGGCTNIMVELINAGADINFKNKKGKTALYNACLDKREGVATLLVQAGADLGGDNEGWTPLMLAASDGFTKLVKEMCYHGADVNARYSCLSALELAATHNRHLEVIKFLADRADQDSLNRAMSWACKRHCVEMMKVLLNRVDAKRYKEYLYCGNEEMKVLLQRFM